MRKKNGLAVSAILLVGLLVFGTQRPSPAPAALGGQCASEPTPAAPADGLLTFAVVGDSREGGFFEALRNTMVNKTRQLIIDKIAESNPAFVVNTGDLVKGSAGKKAWQEFQTENQVFKNKEIMYCPVLGNHEYGGDKTVAMAEYFKCFPVVNNQLWYTLTYANCGLVILDSNFTKLTRRELARQDEWLKDTLQVYQGDTGISFVFVFFHQPPFTNSRDHKPDKDAQRYFVPLLEKFSKVKFVFNGHVHSYERFKIEGINYVVTGGGGAPLMALLPPGKSRYKDEYDTTGRKPRGTHFCLVTVGRNFVELKTLNIDPKKLTWSVGDDYRAEYPQ